MSPDVNEKDVLLLPVSHEFDRLKKIFEDIRPSTVYIIANQNPTGIDDQENEKILNEVRQIVDTNTTPHDDVKEVSTSFYEFETALLDTYRIILREKQNGNNVYVNLVGGTRPVALALSYACSIANTGQPIYYVSRKTEQAEAGLESTGVVDKSIDLLSIPAFDIQHIVPDDHPKYLLLTTLLEMDTHAELNEILAHSGEIQSTVPQEEAAKKTRNKTIRKYHGHATSLVDNDLFEQDSHSRYTLTTLGTLAAKLATIKADIEGPLEQPSSTAPLN